MHAIPLHHRVWIPTNVPSYVTALSYIQYTAVILHNDSQSYFVHSWSRYSIVAERSPCHEVPIVTTSPRVWCDNRWEP